MVRKGEVIARLDNADYQAAVSEQQANLATSQAQLIEAESERDQAQREYNRVKDIRASNPNLVSAQDEEVAQNRMATSAARANAARARIDAAKASLRFAEANLENTYIRAPFSGTVLRKEAEVGEVVAPSVGGGLTRGAVVTMADLSTLEVEVDVNEAYIGRVQHGQSARITLDAYPDTAFRGSVRQVVPTADRQRATVQVKVTILDHDPRILPEMGARVDFIAASPDTRRRGTGRAGGAGVPAAGGGHIRVGRHDDGVAHPRRKARVAHGRSRTGKRRLSRDPAGTDRRRDGPHRRSGEAGAGNARGSTGEVGVPTDTNPSHRATYGPR